jgi:hypothetical protein
MNVQAAQDAENIPLNPTLRLIAIMLRRKVLVGEPTLASLFADNGQLYLLVKPEFQNLPVLIAGVPGGRGLDTKIDRPRRIVLPSS